ncbi:GT4 family glycosyltransferase PelF [Myxococcota bacterium]|nr:GT4 family glycosyltransferase PelF [Myxococcota bacterium]
MSAEREIADVCIVTEGTYPFVRGGVSSWIHGIVTGMPDVRFALLLISAERKESKLAFELPKNIVQFTEVFIHEAVIHDEPCPGRRKFKGPFWEAVEAFHTAPSAGDGAGMHAQLAPFLRMLTGLVDPAQRVVNTHDVLFSRDAWEYLVRRYEARADDTSFIDFVWTWRAIHTPLMQLLNADIPPARCYHLVSTGYAGLIGVMARYLYRRPVMLTEHGIYVRERKIDIARADWIYEEPLRVKTVQRETGVLKQLWTNFFVRIGELTYAHTDEVLTLFNGNRNLQIELGCPPERVHVVPNGVKTDVFAKVREKPRPNDGIRRIGFVGRVVPIKDVKTFIKACALVFQAMPNAEFLICGPKDEEPVYAEECENLGRMLGLTTLIFTGPVDVREYFPKMDVFVLTSISEGQPLTILEAACAGVPTVTSDVGACRELCEGYAPEDRALGPSGLVTGVGHPRETADAILTLLRDERLRQSMIHNGVARAERFYRQEDVLSTYHDLYVKWAQAPDVDLPEGR